MKNNSKLKSLTFTTTRLNVINVDSCMKSESTTTELLSSIVNVLSPLVVQSLPPYFHHIKTTADAEVWLAKMKAESHLFTVNIKDSKPVIGFVFLSESANDTAHLGYLLAESCWQKGYGSELLIGLLEGCRADQLIKKVIAGVDRENVASAKLLQKVGFVAGQEDDNGVIFYEYNLS